MLIGIGKTKVIFRKLSLPLYGYALIGNYAEGSETDLFARAFIFESGNKKVAFVNIECSFISHHLKKALVEKLVSEMPEIGIGDENLMLSAQHTHSAPGGHSHYAFHNITSKGFRPDIFESYLNASFEAISEAWSNREACTIFLNADLIRSDSDIGFNRSLHAYNKNPDVEKQDEMNTHLAINRMMKQLRICSKDNSNKGVINWFGVQANSISSKNNRIHSDNKGYAASMLESDQSGTSPFIAAFCQEAAADVSANYYGRAKWWPRGRYEDDFKSAYANGFCHFEKAQDLIENEDFQIPISDQVDFYLAYFKLSNYECDPRFSHDGLPCKTGTACLGKSFMEGTPPDIEGIDVFSSSFFNLIIKSRETINQLPLVSSAEKRQNWSQIKDSQYPKKILVELEDKRILGYEKLNKLNLPSVLSDISEEINRKYETGSLKEHTWAPVILPIQIIRIGEIAIVGFPGDLTTTAGNRLRNSLLETLEPHGILDVIITCYANEHGGYANTREEYMEQTFEGGFNLFGQYTLAAFQTCFNIVARNMTEPVKIAIPKTEPPEFSKEELQRRTYRHKIKT